MLECMVDHDEVETTFDLIQAALEHSHATAIFQVPFHIRVYSGELLETFGEQIHQECALAATDVQDRVLRPDPGRPEPADEVTGRWPVLGYQAGELGLAFAKGHPQPGTLQTSPSPE